MWRRTASNRRCDDEARTVRCTDLASKIQRADMDDPNALLRELMAVFDDLPAPLRAAINYAPEPLDPKALATLCRRHGAANVLAMIQLKLKRQTGRGR